MRPILLTILIALLTCAASAQRIVFDVLDRNIIQQRVGEYAGNDTQREATLKQLFAEAGCPDLAEQRVKGLKQPNLICTLPGEIPQTIIVGAHFDKVNRGAGVVDNWSGASLLPSLLQSVAGVPRHHTFVFIGFAGEEQGLVGSKFYVKHMTPEQKANLRAMINLDTLGLGPTEAWVSRADPRLVRALAAVAQQMKLPVSGMNMDNVGTSDSESFAKLKVPRITIHSETTQTSHIPHSPDDDLKSLHFDDYYDSYHLVAAYLAYLDVVLPTQAPVAGKAVEREEVKKSR
ncbi:MAG: M28 family metallopeptidase [Terriglobales bacterium]